MNPDGTMLHTIKGEPVSNFGFNAGKEGQYKMCFINTRASHSKYVFFTLSKPDEFHNIQQNAKSSGKEYVLKII